MENQVTVGEDDLWAEKETGETKTYTFNVSGQLSPGNKVTAASWSIAPAGPTVVTSSFTDAGLKVQVAGGTAKKWYAVTCNYTKLNGDTETLTLRLFVKENVDLGLTMGSALFPNRFAAVDSLRKDRLMGVARSAFPGLKVSNDYLWSKLLAAEASVAHSLRVELQPTRFFPNKPTDEQVAALGDMPWKLDPAYDYEPASFVGDKWGFIATRNKPVIEVLRIAICYPQRDNVVLDIPEDWFRIDYRYGQINLVPSGSIASTSFGATLMGYMVGSNRLPMSLNVDYIAGLTDAATNYPDLVDVVLKVATLKILEDAYLPQSGSISADGLSQSMSRDTAKYQETIDEKLFGPKGSNGGLMSLIHGIRLGVF